MNGVDVVNGVDGANGVTDGPRILSLLSVLCFGDFGVGEGDHPDVGV